MKTPVFEAVCQCGKRWTVYKEELWRWKQRCSKCGQYPTQWDPVQPDSSEKPPE